MKNRFLILLSFVLIVGRDVVCANTSMVRERININRDWRYQIDDPDGVGAALHYSRLKPYLLPCANDFIIFGKRYQRPEGNPGENIAYVKSDFDDSEWRHLNLPHDWAIEGPFNIDYNGSTGKLPYWGYAGIVKHWSYRRMMPGNKFILILMGRCHTLPCGVTGNMWVDGLMAMLLSS